MAGTWGRDQERRQAKCKRQRSAKMGGMVHRAWCKRPCQVSWTWPKRTGTVKVEGRTKRLTSLSARSLSTWPVLRKITNLYLPLKACSNHTNEDTRVEHAMQCNRGSLRALQTATPSKRGLAPSKADPSAGEASREAQQTSTAHTPTTALAWPVMGHAKRAPSPSLPLLPCAGSSFSSTTCFRLLMWPSGLGIDLATSACEKRLQNLEASEEEDGKSWSAAWASTWPPAPAERGDAVS